MKNTDKVSNVVHLGDYIQAMSNDIAKKFGNEKHSYLILADYDMYEEVMYRNIENGGECKSLHMEVYYDTDFLNLLSCMNNHIPNVVQLCQFMRRSDYVRVKWHDDTQDKVFHIYQIKNEMSHEFRKLVHERYLLRYSEISNVDYINKLAREFGLCVEPILINE